LKTARTLLLVTLCAGALLDARTASAWVAVRAGPAFIGAAAVGVAAGAVAGAAVASASAPPPTTVVVTPPPPPPAPALGSVVTTLPSGCVQSGGRYQCGSAWYQPYFGSNGVYYQVVAP
jgi:hypothetical protein